MSVAKYGIIDGPARFSRDFRRGGGRRKLRFRGATFAPLAGGGDPCGRGARRSSGDAASQSHDPGDGAHRCGRALSRPLPPRARRIRSLGAFRCQRAGRTSRLIDGHERPRSSGGCMCCRSRKPSSMRTARFAFPFSCSIAWFHWLTRASMSGCASRICPIPPARHSCGRCAARRLRKPPLSRGSRDPQDAEDLGAHDVITVLVLARRRALAAGRLPPDGEYHASSIRRGRCGRRHRPRLLLSGGGL